MNKSNIEEAKYVEFYLTDEEQERVTRACKILNLSEDEFFRKVIEHILETYEKES